MLFARKPVGFQHSKAAYHNNTFLPKITIHIYFRTRYSSLYLKKQTTEIKEV